MHVWIESSVVKVKKNPSNLKRQSTNHTGVAEILEKCTAGKKLQVVSL